MTPFVAALTTLLLAPAAPAQPPTGVTCLETGKGVVTFDAGRGVLAPRTGTVAFDGIAGPCRSSDPALRSATVVGVAPVTLDCLRGFHAWDTGVFTVSWNNGDKSVLEYAEDSRLLFGHSDGTVVRGRFKGMRVHNDDLEGGDPSICVRRRGKMTGFYLGVFSIGGGR